MGLSYALGPFPDEPLISTIDKTILLTSGLRSKYQNRTNTLLLNRSLGTDCAMEREEVSKSKSKSCPDLSPVSSKESFKEKPDLSMKVASSSDNILGPSATSKADKLNRMWVETKTTPDGIKSYEIWSEQVSEISPSMIFILSPNGQVIPFEFLPNK